MVRKGATARLFDRCPAVALHIVKLSAPTFQDPLGDYERLKYSLINTHKVSPSIEIDYQALSKLPAVLRQGNWTVTVTTWMEKEIIDIKPGQASDDAYGLAIDVGTTSVAAYLCRLKGGALIATETMMNPQVAYGEDVMSRINYVMHNPEGLETLHHAIITGLNRLILRTANEAGVSAEDIVEMTVVGNPVMHHLLFGINPQHLGSPPYSPAIHKAINIKARELGLKVNAAANVYSLPLAAGFVGADTMGVILAERPYLKQKITLIIDVGTNGELVLGNRDRLVAASCATGPALEGAQITFGMRAAAGAIERIKIDSGTFDVKFKVLGRERGSKGLKGSRAQGICGSGIIDGVAELFRTGAIDTTGRFNRNINSPRFLMNDGSPEFVIAWRHETSLGKDITISQRDVRNVQLAKGAIYTGAIMLMRLLGINKIDRVTLAGAFGSCIDPTAALIIGMFPDCDLKNVSAVGNAAGDGARLALLDRKKRWEVEKIAARVEYLELTIAADFQKEFMDSLNFPNLNVSGS